MNIKEIISKLKEELSPREKIALEEILQNKDNSLDDGFFQNKKNDWTEWEKKVKKKLIKSSVKFEEKFRKFPLFEDDEIFYEPDFVLDFPYNGRRRVIVEVQEERTEKEIKKYQEFLKVYGKIYWLILVVKYEELRNWNEVSEKIQNVSHEIWTLNDIDDLIKCLENLREIEITNDEKENASCPRCGKTAQGKFEVTELFGYRYEGKVVQSHCRTCRSSKEVVNFPENKFQEKPKEVTCPTCGRWYMEKIRGESCCPICLKKWDED